MWYIISQIIFCLLVAALLGGVIGWLARGILSENRQTKSERRLRSVVNSREQ